jgi:ankyrin repeat protein
MSLSPVNHAVNLLNISFKVPEEQDDSKPAILDPTEQEAAFVQEQFMQSCPEGFTITKISRIYNQEIHARFLNRLAQMDKEAALFPTSWEDDPCSEARKYVIDHIWKNLTYTPPEFTDAKILLQWHGTTLERSELIAGGGIFPFGKQHSFHNEYLENDSYHEDYGNGICFSDSAQGASLLGKKVLVLSLVSVRSPYPVVSDKPFPYLRGKGAFKTYDAHLVPISRTTPNTPSSKHRLPSYHNQPHEWNECLIFQNSQASPLFIVELTPDPIKDSLNTDFTFERGYQAAQRGELELLKKWILQNKGRLQMTNDRGESLLFAAVAGNQKATLEWLFSQDNSLLKKFRLDGWTLTHVAAALGLKDIFKRLIEIDPSAIFAKNAQRLTPVEVAAFHEKIQILEPYAANLIEDHSLVQKLVQAPCELTLDFLLKNGLKIDCKDQDRNSLFHLAAKKGQAENISLLAEHKDFQANFLNEKNKQRETALYLAACNGHSAALFSLIHKGANPSQLNADGNSILHGAARGSYGALLHDMLSFPEIKGLLNAPNELGEFPLHHAIQGEAEPEVVRLLLAEKGDPNGADDNGFTPLHYAVMKGSVKCAQYLVQSGAIVVAKNDDQKTPLDLAISAGHDSFVFLFLQMLIDQGIAKDPSDQLITAATIDQQINSFIQEEEWVKANRVLNSAFERLETDFISSQLHKYWKAKKEKLEALAVASYEKKLLQEKKSTPRSSPSSTPRPLSRRNSSEPSSRSHSPSSPPRPISRKNSSEPSRLPQKRTSVSERNRRVSSDSDNSNNENCSLM